MYILSTIHQLFKGVFKKEHIICRQVENNTLKSEYTIAKVYFGVFFNFIYLHVFSAFQSYLTESSIPITLIGNVNILTNSVGLLYLSFR